VDEIRIVARLACSECSWVSDPSAVGTPEEQLAQHQNDDHGGSNPTVRVPVYID